MTPPSREELPTTKEAIHYLGAIKVRLELLYENSTQDSRLLEHLSDEVDWVDAEIERLRGGVAQAPPSPRDDAWVLDTAKELSDVLTAKYCRDGFWRNVSAEEIVNGIRGFRYVRTTVSSTPRGDSNDRT
jgi:hypothetical protein